MTSVATDNATSHPPPRPVIPCRRIVHPGSTTRPLPDALPPPSPCRQGIRGSSTPTSVMWQVPYPLDRRSAMFHRHRSPSPCTGSHHLAAPRSRDHAHKRTVRFGKLVIWKCQGCATVLAPSTTTCHGCGSDTLEPIDSAGAGVIVSCRVVEGAPDPLRGAPCPSVLAIVELDEGPWVYSWIDSDVPMRPDRRMRVSYRSTQPGERFPSFELRD